MKERPILMSAPMVRAILAGTKTQTRRVVKQPQRRDGLKLLPELLRDIGVGGACPYGQPGDRLWLREAWRVCGGREYEYQQDRSQVMYRATHHEDGFPLTWESYKWRPSIHMPRWASRITLEVTGVRVERLQDISEADAVAEGAPPSHPSIDRISREFGYADFPRSWYAQLWESINGPGSWQADPWVWVVEFRPLPGEGA